MSWLFDGNEIPQIRLQHVLAKVASSGLVERFGKLTLQAHTPEERGLMSTKEVEEAKVLDNTRAIPPCMRHWLTKTNATGYSW